jgi:L,D-transpeptidase ErfK/SrfK
VLSRSTGYRVLAGPFDTRGEAREAARRLKIDLEIDGVVIEPSRVN